MPDVEFEANGETAPGYLALPESGRGPGVVVVQEWWGLEDHIKDICDRFAAEGFLALAPDLYRGETTEQPDEAQQKMMAMSMDQAEKDMRGAVDYLAAHEQAQGSGVGSVGFCLGGGGEPEGARVGHVLLRDASRQARLLEAPGPGPRALRRGGRVRIGRERE